MQGQTSAFTDQRQEGSGPKKLKRGGTGLTRCRSAFDPWHPRKTRKAQQESCLSRDRIRPNDCQMWPKANKKEPSPALVVGLEV